MRLALILLLMLVPTTAHTAEVTNLLENLVVQEENVDLLENLVRNKKEEQFQQRLYTFFKRNKVVRPAYYAQLIIDHPMPIRQKKVMAAILVPETRGVANAVSPAGATGPWQVMRFWKKQLNIKGSLKDPIINLNAAVRVYNIHARDAKHDERKTLVAYSGRTPGYATKVQRLVESI